MISERPALKKAIFFSKNRTLLEDIPFNVNPQKINLMKGAKEALYLLKNKFQLHVMSHESGVALGIYSEQDLWSVKEKLQELFKSSGAELTEFHYCPHFPQGNIKKYSLHCDCRMPGSLMIEEASKEFKIDLSDSWMIGDTSDDIECGKRVGCKTVLVDNGQELSNGEDPLRTPDYRVQDLEEAALLILNAAT